MANISLWEAMKRIESLNPQWEYKWPRLFFETTTTDGVVSVLIEDGYQENYTSSSPITNDGFRVTITSNGHIIFRGIYSIKYKSGFWNTSKPHYSEEYKYIKAFFEQFAERERAIKEEALRKEKARKEVEAHKTQQERNKFFGR